MNQPPVADFIYGPADPEFGKTVLFTDLSLDIDGEIVSWFWDFGDGNNATAEIVNYSYEGPGLYKVTSTVTDDKGNTDSDTTTAEILIPNRSPSKQKLSGRDLATETYFITSQSHQQI